MKILIMVFVFGIISFSAFSQIWSLPGKAKHYIGQTANFFGYVSDATSINKNGTILTLSGNDPTTSLKVVLLSGNNHMFKVLSESPYLYQYVQVRGKVEISNGGTQINVNDEDQISIVRESPPIDRHPY